jgi:hypothetical protein
MVTAVYKIVSDMWCTRRNVVGPLDEFGPTKCENTYNYNNKNNNNINKHQTRM